MKEEQKLAQKKACQLTEAICLKTFEKQLVNGADHLTQESKTVFVQKNKERLVVLFTLPFYFDAALHDIRKVVKDLMYNHKYVQKELNVELLMALSRVKKMETIAAILGDFHDLCVALFLVSPMYVEHLPGLPEKNLLSEYKMQLETRKEALKSKILQSFAPIKQQFERESLLMRSFEMM